MRARAKVVLGAALSACLALGAAACQVLLGIDDEAGVTRPSDASAEAADASEAGPVVCNGLHPPDERGVDTGSGPPLYFALRTLSAARDVGDGGEGGVAGYDVDHHCTFADADLPCVGSPDDADGGVDNAFAALLQKVPSSNGADPFAWTEQIGEGHEGIFFALYNYSGADDDGTVSFAMVPSPGIVSTDCDASTGAPGGPKWDGCDVWSLGDAPIVSSTLTNLRPGYVVGRTLVVTYDEVPMRLGLFFVTLHGAIVTATLERDDGGVALVDGVIAGRVRAEDLNVGLGEVYVKVGGKSTPICDSALRDTLHDEVCKGRDLRLADDNTAATCDAFSLGVSFSAAPVPFGVAGDAAPPPACAPIDASCP